MDISHKLVIYIYGLIDNETLNELCAVINGSKTFRVYQRHDRPQIGTLPQVPACSAVHFDIAIGSHRYVAT